MRYELMMGSGLLFRHHLYIQASYLYNGHYFNLPSRESTFNIRVFKLCLTYAPKKHFSGKCFITLKKIQSPLLKNDLKEVCCFTKVNLVVEIRHLAATTFLFYFEKTNCSHGQLKKNINMPIHDQILNVQPFVSVEKDIYYFGKICIAGFR